MRRLPICLAALMSASVVTAAAPPYSVVSTIDGPDGGWDLLSVDPAAHRLYIARSAGVSAIDLATSKVRAGIVQSNHGHDAMVIPGTTQVLSTSGSDNSATLFDGVTGRVIATLHTGTKPDAVAWDPLTRTAWVMAPGSGEIDVVDPLAPKVVATIAVGGSLELGASNGEGQLYVNVEDRNEVAVLDTRSRKVVARLPLKGCDGPTGIAYAPDMREIISACANGVAIVSAPDGRQIASVKVGPGPDGAAYDAERHLAFIPSGGDGTLSIIALRPSPHVVSVVPTARGARTIALDPSTGRLYLPSAKYLPATGTGRSLLAPGSFKVLVVAPGEAR